MSRAGKAIGRSIAAGDVVTLPRGRVAAAGALTDAKQAAIKALRRAWPYRAATTCAADITILEIAARMAAGLPVSEDAVREVGRRYVELIVELGKQVDARMSAEADAQKLTEYAQAGLFEVTP